MYRLHDFARGVEVDQDVGLDLGAEGEVAEGASTAEEDLHDVSSMFSHNGRRHTSEEEHDTRNSFREFARLLHRVRDGNDQTYTLKREHGRPTSP